MNKKVFIYFFLYLLTVPNIALAKWGKGELKLDKSTMENLLMYMYGAGNPKYSGDEKRKNDPMIFAVSEDGSSSMYYYCPSQYNYECMDNNTAYKAIKGCEELSRGVKCYTLAKKRKIVWKNGGPKVKIKKKDLKSAYKVAKLIQDAGFYDGDVSKLAGINVKSGQVDEEIGITGEKKDSTSENKTTQETDIVKQLEDLKELYESGSLTKKEFDKAKKKLLAN